MRYGAAPQPRSQVRLAHTRHKIPEAVKASLLAPIFGAKAPTAAQPQSLLFLLFVLVRKRLAQAFRVLWFLKASLSSLTKHFLKPIYTHPCISSLVVLLAAESLFALWFKRAYRRWTNFTHEMEVNDGPQAFERVLDFIQGFTGRPALGVKLRAYISKWFLGADWHELRQGNLEEHIAYSFFYKSPDAVRAAGQGELLQTMLTQLMASAELHDVAPGYAPGVKAMWHLEEPLRAQYKPLVFYLAMEGLAGLTCTALWCLGFKKGRANGCNFWYYGVPTLPTKRQLQSRNTAIPQTSNAATKPAVQPTSGKPSTASTITTGDKAAKTKTGDNPFRGGSSSSGKPNPSSNLSQASKPGVKSSSTDGGSKMAVATPGMLGPAPAVTSKTFRPSFSGWGQRPVASDPAAIYTKRSWTTSAACTDVPKVLTNNYRAAASATPSDAEASKVVMGLDGAPVSRVGESSTAMMTNGAATALPYLHRPPHGLVTGTPAGFCKSSPFRNIGSQSCPTFQDLIDYAQAVAKADADADATNMHEQQLLQQEAGVVAQPVPLVFLHGVGIGLLPYLPVVWRLLRGAAASRAPLLVMEFKHVSLRLCRQVPTADTAATTVAAALNQLSLTQACVVAHSYGTFVASRLTQMFPHRIKGLALIDPVCFGMFLPHLLFNFVYNDKARNDSWWHFVKDSCVRFAASELHCAATFCRRFYWHQVQLDADQLPHHSLVVLGGRDELLHGEEVATAIAGVAAARQGGAPSPFPLSPAPRPVRVTRPTAATSDAHTHESPLKQAKVNGDIPGAIDISGSPTGEIKAVGVRADTAKDNEAPSEQVAAHSKLPPAVGLTAPVLPTAVSTSATSAPLRARVKPLPPLTWYTPQGQAAPIDGSLDQTLPPAQLPSTAPLTVGGTPAGSVCQGPGTVLNYRPAMAHADFMFQPKLLKEVVDEVLRFAEALGSCTKPCCTQPLPLPPSTTRMAPFSP